MHLVEPFLKFRLGDTTLGKGFAQGRRGGVAVGVACALSGIRCGHEVRLVPELRESRDRGRMGAWSDSAW